MHIDHPSSRLVVAANTTSNGPGILWTRPYLNGAVDDGFHPPLKNGLWKFNYQKK